MSTHRRARKRSYTEQIERALAEQEADPVRAWTIGDPAVEATEQIASFVSEREAALLQGLADIGHPDGFDVVAEAERLLRGPDV